MRTQVSRCRGNIEKTVAETSQKRKKMSLCVYKLVRCL